MTELAPFVLPRPDRLPPLDTTTLSGTRRILVAEDNPGMLRLLTRALRQDGHDVVQARDGLELMFWVRRMHPSRADDPGFDLVVTDLRMPHFTGQQCLELLRGLGNRTPVIVITAFGDPEAHATAIAHGATAVVDKPLRLDDLCERIGQLLG